MANVSISEIPNAPQLTNPVAIPQEGANTNLTSSLGPMQQQSMSLDAFSGKARGLEALGESAPRVAAVFGDISQAITHANDVSGAAKATNIMDSAYTNHMAAMAKEGIPPDQWAAKWTSESLPKAQDAISKIQVSPRAAEGMNAQVSMWGTSATSRINLAGITQHIQDGKLELNTAIENAFARGDFEGATNLIHSGTTGHFWDTGEEKNRIEELNQRQLTNHVYADMNANPRQSAEELEIAKSGDKEAIAKLSPLYQEVAKGNSVTTAQYAYQARRIAGVTASETMNTVIEGVDSGDIKTKEDVDKLNKSKGGIFSAPQLKQAYNVLSLNVPYDPAKAAALHLDIANVNSEQDQDLSKKLALLNRVGTDIPAPLRPTYAEMIQKAYNPTPDTKIPTLIKQGNFAQVQDWKKAGLLGATGMDGTTVSTKPEDVLAYNKLAQREVDYQVAFEQAQEDGSVKTPDQAEAFTQKFWSPEIQANSAKVKANIEPSRFEKLFGAPAAPVPYAPADAQKAIDNGLPKATPGAAPSPTPTTHYSISTKAGGTDEKHDKWTDAGKTATGDNLTPGVVAVNPEVYPYGTIFKDENGFAYIAADKHGNKDPNVVDFYQPPKAYGQPTPEKLAVVGKVPFSKIPKDADGIFELLKQYGQVPAGESAAEFLKFGG
jgi:3D (Asp-Asp-Asp) domain-containing protein